MSRVQIPRAPKPRILDPKSVNPEAAVAGNRRQWPRYAFPKRESFTVTAGTHIGACAIEDISLGGARLRMDGPLPANLEIEIVHPRFGHAYARRCWTTENRLGVAFDHSEPSLAFIADCVAEGIEIGRAEPGA